MPLKLILMTVCTLLLNQVCFAEANNCSAIALRDAPALEDPATKIVQGSKLDFITQYLVNKFTGETYLCSHGGFCYHTRVQVNDVSYQALRLTNCTIDGKDQGDFFDYGLIQERSSIPPAELRYDDVDGRLRELGLCSACADNVARFLTEKPRSRCGILAQQALEGNQEALGTLSQQPNYCQFR
jgi:hypothetical protein